MKSQPGSVPRRKVSGLEMLLWGIFERRGGGKGKGKRKWGNATTCSGQGTEGDKITEKRTCIHFEKREKETNETSQALPEKKKQTTKTQAINSSLSCFAFFVLPSRVITLYSSSLIEKRG